MFAVIDISSLVRGFRKPESHHVSLILTFNGQQSRSNLVAARHDHLLSLTGKAFYSAPASAASIG
jgi:hypothetical protein